MSVLGWDCASLDLRVFDHGGWVGTYEMSLKEGELISV
jgi:hypothetical protein